ncbi:MAG TPA: hypothetical protein VK633_12745, partial [Verrucomicrobiae bacterium]|nr:hypothetical protein [Verrucomicrobiae bacterium]
MPNDDPNEFTEREKFILSYYRSKELSSSRHVLFYDVIVVLASVGCAVALSRPTKAHTASW